ncbi:tyrosine-protein phosphatase [Bifidobacterium favimelis]|uniref:Tyrosine-protein phosphatase n=1 Tax=Bifidobacterium favimelis TaxID=3122979 RepID=A0ABU8ZNZ8_9BIFI
MTEDKTAIDGLYNFRDLGGMPTSGGRIRRGLLFRSEALAGLTEKGKRQMEASPVRLVLDLRAGQEVKAMPDPDLAGIDNVNIPMLDGSMPLDADDEQRRERSSLDAAGLLRQAYLSLIANNGPDYVQVLHRTAAMAAQGAGTLIHCSAGKDRTGTSIAFLLDLVGADRGAVIADYASSQANLSGAWERSMLDQISRAGVQMPARLRPMIVLTPPELITQILDRLDESYGSVAGYLLEMGADQADIDTLRRVLVED